MSDNLEKENLHIVPKSDEPSDSNNEVSEFGHVMQTSDGPVRFTSLLSLKALLIGAIRNAPDTQELSSDNSFSGKDPIPFVPKKTDK